MIVVSQNLLKYGVEIPPDAILRFNLAWHENLNDAAVYLHEHTGNKIFLDVPVGRRKPPNYSHDIDDIMILAIKFPNIEYVAISNIENASQVIYYQAIFKGIKTVPKIESYLGLRNIKDIILALNYKDKVIMLDHQDLYSDLLRMEVESDYLALVEALEMGCKSSGVRLLKTIGIIFSDGEDS